VPFVRVGFFVVCLFVKFCTVDCSLGLQLTVCGLAKGGIFSTKVHTKNKC
jgi:hypothetical protein